MADLLDFPMTQQQPPNQNVWVGSAPTNYSGNSPYNAVANMTPAPGGNDFPNSPPVPSPVTAKDNNGNSNYTGTLNVTTYSTKQVGGKLTVTIPGGGAFSAPPITITITLTYGNR